MSCLTNVQKLEGDCSKGKNRGRFYRNFFSRNSTNRRGAVFDRTKCIGKN